MRRREYENLFIVLKKTGWKIKGVDGAAELLGVKPTTLISRIRKLGLKPSDSSRIAPSARVNDSVNRRATSPNNGSMI